MTDRAMGAVDTRLEALAAVSRQYATFGYLAAGLGVIPLSLLAVVIGMALWLGWVKFACALGALTPLASLAFALASRRWYQRHGYVDESGVSFGTSHPTGPEIAWWVGWILVGAWLVQALLTLWGMAQARVPLDERFVGSFPLLGVLSTAALLRWNPPRRSDGFWAGFIVPGNLTSTITLMFVAGMKRGPLDSFMAWTFLLMGLSSGVLGVWSHFKYRELERRLLALREGW